MIHNNRYRWLVCFFSMLSVVSSIARADKAVIFPTDPWPPYILDDPSGFAKKGIAVDIVNAIFQRLDGYKAQFPIVPWNRALHQVKKGQSDGIAALLKTKDRESFMIFSEPILEDRTLIYFRKDRFPGGLPWKTTKDLSRYKIAIQNGFSYGSLIDNAIAKHNLSIEAVNSVEQAMLMVHRARIDLVLVTERVAKSILRKNSWQDDFSHSVKPVHQDIYHIGLSRLSPIVDKLGDINRIISDLKSEGKLNLSP